MISIGTHTLPAKCVIFDKDGTLIDLHAQWVPWIQHALTRVREILGDEGDILDHIAVSVGYDAKNARILPDSPLATASRNELLVIIATALYQRGLSWVQAIEVSQRLENGLEERSLALPRGDVCRLFMELHAHDVKIAVVTADSRTHTRAALEHLGLMQWVDALVCGDDGLRGKPAPNMLHRALAEVNISAAESLMVGDTFYDVLMAERAGIAMCIGIAGGGGSADMLIQHCPIVIHSLDEIRVT